MAASEITIQFFHRNLRDALAREEEKWPEEKVRRFQKEWKALERAGAEIVEVRLAAGVIQAFPSEDFTMHCRAFGIFLE